MHLPAFAAVLILTHASFPHSLTLWLPMAEFSPELEDGERWLPANILNDVGVRRRPFPLPFPASSDGIDCFPRLAYFHALARELASLGPFHRRDVSTSRVFPPSPHYFVRFLSLLFLFSSLWLFAASLKLRLAGVRLTAGPIGEQCGQIRRSSRQAHGRRRRSRVRLVSS